jgi:hypothetical protein
MTDTAFPDLSAGPPTRATGGVNPDTSHAGESHAGETCKNCGATMQGEYCHVCGQHGHVSRSVLHVLEEVLHGITHFDSRTMRSVPMLAFRPGTLTRNYVMGQRARYVPPFAMFLFTVFAMFLVFALTGGPGIVNEATPQSRAEAVSSALADVREAEAGLAALQAEVARADAALQALPANAEVGDRVDAEVEARTARVSLETGQTEVQLARAALARAEALPAPPQSGTGTGDAATGQDKETPALTISTEDERTVSEQIAESLRDSDVQINTPWPQLNKKIQHKLENPELFLYKLQNTAYKFSFLLIPLSLPFLWLLFFWKRGVTLYDHAVFALYSLSFISLLFIVVGLLSKWPAAGEVTGWALLIPPVHLFFQFKGAYALGWFSALWRTIVFTFVFAWLAIAAFLLSILALGVL